MLSEHRWKLWVETLGQLSKVLGTRMRRRISVILKAEGRTTVNCRAYQWTIVPSKADDLKAQIPLLDPAIDELAFRYLVG